MRGNCYVCVESLFYLLGGKEAGYTPHYVDHEHDTHWYLVHEQQVGMHGVSRLIIDPTASQFKTPVPYHLGKPCGFLTKEPSYRARQLMEKMLWQLDT